MLTSLIEGFLSIPFWTPDATNPTAKTTATILWVIFSSSISGNLLMTHKKKNFKAAIMAIMRVMVRMKKVLLKLVKKQNSSGSGPTKILSMSSPMTTTM